MHAVDDNENLYIRSSKGETNLWYSSSCARYLVAAARVLHLLHRLVDRPLLHAVPVGTLARRIILQTLQVRGEERARGCRSPELLG